MSTELLTNMQDNNVTLFWGGETRGYASKYLHVHQQMERASST